MVNAVRIRAMALALPEATEADHHGMASFRVGGKIFATLRGDPPRLMAKLASDDQHNFCGANPESIRPVPGYWGRKGSTFVDFESIDERLLDKLLQLAWFNVAPARLRRAG